MQVFCLTDYPKFYNLNENKKTPTTDRQEIFTKVRSSRSLVSPEVKIPCLSCLPIVRDFHINVANCYPPCQLYILANY